MTCRLTVVGFGQWFRRPWHLVPIEHPWQLQPDHARRSVPVFVREGIRAPVGIAIAPDLTYYEGHLYVVARGAHTIYPASLDGEISLFAGSGERGRDGPAAQAQFSFPNDIAVDPARRAFYVNEIASTTGDGRELSPMVVRRIRLQ